jgi:hypothetical protein
MTAPKPKSRRQAIKETPRTHRKLDDTPIELGAGKRTIPDTRAMVRAYVHQALEQAGATHGYDTVEQMLEEELDIDPEDPEPPWTSQYEVQELDDEDLAPPYEGALQNQERVTSVDEAVQEETPKEE